MVAHGNSCKYVCMPCSFYIHLPQLILHTYLQQLMLLINVCVTYTHLHLPLWATVQNSLVMIKAVGMFGVCASTRRLANSRFNTIYELFLRSAFSPLKIGKNKGTKLINGDKSPGIQEVDIITICAISKVYMKNWISETNCPVVRRSTLLSFKDITISIWS